MKVLLIQPAGNCEKLSSTLANHSEPLGLCYVAAYAKQQGNDVQIIHQITESDDKIIRMVEEYRPDLVGFSTMTYNFNNAIAIADMIKQTTPAKIVFGGVHVTADIESIKHRSIDYIVRGEGDHTFSELIYAIENFASEAQLRKIKGIVFNDKSEIINTGMPDRITALDSLSFPLREGLLVGEAKYVRHGLVYPAVSKQRRASINASRGCLHKCSFCTSPMQWSYSQEYRSAKNVVDEIELLIDKYQINYFELRDENFTQNRTRAIKICDEINTRGIKISWYCQGRISDIIKGNFVDTKLLENLKAAGCFEIEYGIESGLDKSLERMQKGITIQQTQKVVKVTQEAGLVVHALMILGFPWEIKQDLVDSVCFARELEVDKYRFAFFVPFKGSASYEAINKEQIKDKNINNWTTDTPVVSLKDMNLSELHSFRNYAYTAVYTTSFYERCKNKAAIPKLKETYEDWMNFIRTLVV